MSFWCTLEYVKITTELQLIKGHSVFLSITFVVFYYENNVKLSFLNPGREVKYFCWSTALTRSTELRELDSLSSSTSRQIYKLTIIIAFSVAVILK